MEREVVRWYTRARKFPQLIGRTHDGARILGGPYTYAQFIGGFIVLFVGVNTMSLWGGFGLITNAALLAGITWGAVWMIGRVPVGSRNPMSVVIGFLRAVASPRLGRLRGRQPRVPRPHTVHHRVIIAAPALPQANPNRPTTPAAPPPANVGTRPAPLTGVQELLAASRTSPRTR